MLVTTGAGKRSLAALELKGCASEENSLDGEPLDKPDDPDDSKALADSRPESKAAVVATEAAETATAKISVRCSEGVNSPS